MNDLDDVPAKKKKNKHYNKEQINEIYLFNNTHVPLKINEQPDSSISHIDRNLTCTEISKKEKKHSKKYKASSIYEHNFPYQSEPNDINQNDSKKTHNPVQVALVNAYLCENDVNNYKRTKKKEKHDSKEKSRDNLALENKYDFESGWQYLENNNNANNFLVYQHESNKNIIFSEKLKKKRKHSNNIESNNSNSVNLNENFCGKLDDDKKSKTVTKNSKKKKKHDPVDDCDNAVPTLLSDISKKKKKHPVDCDNSFQTLLNNNLTDDKNSKTFTKKPKKKKKHDLIDDCDNSFQTLVYNLDDDKYSKAITKKTEMKKHDPVDDRDNFFPTLLNYNSLADDKYCKSNTEKTKKKKKYDPVDDYISFKTLLNNNNLTDDKNEKTFTKKPKKKKNYDLVDNLDNSVEISFNNDFLSDDNSSKTLIEKLKTRKKHDLIDDCSFQNSIKDNFLTDDKNSKTLTEKSKKKKKHDPVDDSFQNLTDNFIADDKNSTILIKKSKKKKKHDPTVSCDDSFQILLKDNVIVDDQSSKSHSEKPKKKKNRDHSFQNLLNTNFLADDKNSKTLTKKSKKKRHDPTVGCDDSFQILLKDNVLADYKSSKTLSENRKKEKEPDEKNKHSESSVSEHNFSNNSESNNKDNSILNNISLNAEPFLTIESSPGKDTRTISGKETLNKNKSKRIDSPSKHHVTNKVDDPYTSEDNVSIDFISGMHSFQYPTNYLEQNADKDFLDFDVPPLHENESVSVPTKEMLQEFKIKGIKIKTGKWSDEELSILRKNFNNFVEKYGIKDPIFLFGIGQKLRSKDSLNFIRNTRFYVQLGKNLNNRTLRSIYVKGRDIFNPLKSKIAANKEEISHILKKQKLTGNKWTEIGIDIDRKAENSHEIYRWNVKSVSKGKWSEEEEEFLKNAIKQVLDTSNLSPKQMKNISWNKVAELVPSRNYSQCYHYWAEHLAWSDWANKKKWTRECYAKLIYLIKKKYYEDDESKVDWEKLQESFHDVSPSYVFLKKKWRHLKSKLIDEKNKTFKNKLDFLLLLYKNKI